MFLLANSTVLTPFPGFRFGEHGKCILITKIKCLAASG